MTNEELIFNTARADGMPQILATIIVAQAKHETGNFTHRFFTTGKNAFGYSYVSGAKWQLPTPGPKADNGVAIAQYATIENSVHELTDWIKRRQKEGAFPADLSTISTAAQYAQLLKNKGYFGASLSSYTAALENWLKKMGEIATEPLTWVIIAATAALVYRYRKQLFS